MAETLLGFIGTKLRSLRRFPYRDNKEKEFEPSSEEEARRFGQRFNAAWGGGPDESSVSELSRVLHSSRNELLNEVAHGTVSPIVSFVVSITQKERNLVSSSLFPIQRVLKHEGNNEPTLGDIRAQVERLNSEVTRGVQASASTVNFGARRIAFLTSGFQKLQ